MKIKKIAIIGDYPPRKCGIATFTKDLNNGIKFNGVETKIIAINDTYEKYFYSSDVCLEIEQNEVATYINAANYLNTNGFDAVILQHEFGIFGGKCGKHILQLLKRLRMPIFTTLHTILDDPNAEQKYIVKEIALYSHRLISMSKMGCGILNDIYGIPKNHISHIHHGVHQMSGNAAVFKQKLALENKTILLTFGLISRNKSIEVVINALPNVVSKHPDVVYIVLGATHPHVVKNDGEEYRHSLLRLVNKLGLERNVVFIDRFISNEELFEYLQCCNIYVTPYSGKKQITSGTLIYAMNAGKPIVSTPFWYAKEMLADDRGVLFDFGNSEQLGLILNDLIGNKSKKDLLSNNALNLAKECYWENIGKIYVDMINKDVMEKQIIKRESYQITENQESKYTLPRIKLTHLKALTDDTGMLQHARYNVPNRMHGYCIDDNARGLIVSTMLQNDIQEIDKLKEFTRVFLSFIDYAYNPSTGKFRNFMGYDRHWLEEEGSEDSQGRTIWALGYTSVNTNDGNFCRHANYLFDKAVKIIPLLQYPRALAYAILGLTYHVEVNHNLDRISLLQEKAKQLYSFFDTTIDNKDWPWFEDVVTYANARIPQAMMVAGMFLQNDLLIQRGIQLLDWLIKKQFHNGIFSPIGNNGWLNHDKKAKFDQQPLEVNGMIDACLQAEIYKKDGQYLNYAHKAFAWFVGDNDLSDLIYDFSTGGCCDGLNDNGVNKNQGAESTLSWLMSLLNLSSQLSSENISL